MKKTNTCPKCGGNRILRVEDGAGRTGISLYLGFMSMTPVARYVCTGCGYTESWVDEDYLPELRDLYAQENHN